MGLNLFFALFFWGGGVKCHSNCYEPILQLGQQFVGRPCHRAVWSMLQSAALSLLGYAAAVGVEPAVLGLVESVPEPPSALPTAGQYWTGTTWSLTIWTVLVFRGGGQIWWYRVFTEFWLALWARCPARQPVRALPEPRRRSRPDGAGRRRRRRLLERESFCSHLVIYLALRSFLLSFT